MLSKKSLTKVVATSLLTGSLLGIGTLSEVSAHAASKNPTTTLHTHTKNKNVINTLHDIYNAADNGEMPGNVQGIKVNKSTKKDVHSKLGNPEKVEGQFDLYSWDMGQNGYGFAYNKDNTISEIRNFGTGVERQTNLGGITPDLLGEQLGLADKILKVPGTDEIDYVYKTGDYELHFVIGDNQIINGFDQTVNHINLKNAE